MDKEVYSNTTMTPKFKIPIDFGTEETYREKFSEELLLKEFGKSAYEKIGSCDKAIRIKLEADYLRQLTLSGAKKRFGEKIDTEMQERIDLELQTIKTTGLSEYFLIVQDLINAMREINVLVSPGRGTTASSIVAYSLHITDVNPIEYNLQFERFLNSDNNQKPSFLFDFEDNGRETAIRYLTEKFGKERAIRVITNNEIDTELAYSEKENRIVELESKLWENIAYPVEIIIGAENPTDLSVFTIINKETKEEILATKSYNPKLAEIYFMGLAQLSVIKKTLLNIQKTKHITIDIDNIPLDNAKVYELFSQGKTVGVFQFESQGMQKYLQELQPSRFEELIAMYALYRPRAMNHIPDYIDRKHGRKEITYDFPEMEKYLKETYGIVVYQEQIMQMSRELAGFTGNQADTLRRLFGTKRQPDLDLMKEQFFAGAKKNGFASVEKLEKVWNDWYELSAYAFNKSHSVSYTLISYQTAWLKANYPLEYMSALISESHKDDWRRSMYLEECKAMGINPNELLFN